MIGGYYRLDKPVRAVSTNGGQNNLVLLPEGSLLLITDCNDVEKLITVKWEQTDVLVFAEDVREHGSMLSA